MKRIIPLLFLMFLYINVSGQPSPKNTLWQPLVEMDGEIFPSRILATANFRRPPGRPTYIGDWFGYFGLSVTNPADNTLVRITINIDRIADPTTYEVRLEKAGLTYEIFPYIKYHFDMLTYLKQPFPANLTIQVAINKDSAETVNRRVRVHSINECPWAWVHRNGPVRPQGWMYAAYVNEDHPWIDTLLREALNTGVVPQFIGYQGSQDDVIAQVFAIWNVLQRRGFRYSSITTTSASSNRVYSQYVRFLSDSIQTSQANCVDGSVLFAAILRKIGIDPFLMLMPGHCMVGFYVDREHKKPIVLETTMLGQTDLRQYDEDHTIMGGLAHLLGRETRNQASYRCFVAAVYEGVNRLQREGNVSPDDPQHQIIDIARERQKGITPISR